MKRWILGLIVIAVGMVLVVSCTKKEKSDLPGEGITVRPARATWDTGYFQEALIRKGMETLGYTVKPAADLANPIFYQSVALGDLDYWANGWFPNHWGQTPKNFKESADIYGTVVKAGGLQGYLVSKDYVEKFNILSLDDFKRPEVKKAFDTNGDGKADLVACPPGWGCEGVITHHFAAYELDEHINPIKASYSASMADVLAKQKKGQPVFFYTWAPNWTIFKLKPGEDVMWINVPYTAPKESQQSGVEMMEVTGVVGAVTDTLKAGFVVSDINIVANNKFMEENPAVKAFFAEFSLPLADINEQNTKMQDGEKSDEDISRHADEWIAKNQAKWNGWLDKARAAVK